MSFPSVWPSRCMHSVGARNSFFEAPFLARRCLCLHFTRHLTAPSARLEVKMVRYSFLVGLFHPRLHAGLSRRLRMLTHGGSVTIPGTFPRLAVSKRGKLVTMSLRRRQWPILYCSRSTRNPGRMRG